MSYSFLLQHCPTCNVRLTWNFSEMRGKWPYNSSLACAATRINLEQCAAFLCSFHLAFFSKRFVSVRVVHPYISMDTPAAWKKIQLYFIRLIWELIFYWLRTFCPHLGSFCVVSSSLRFGQISPLAFFRWLTAIPIKDRLNWLPSYR